MSERKRKPGLGYAAVLVGVAIGPLVAACDAPVPTELRETIGEVIAQDAGEGSDAGLENQGGESTLAKWFDSDAAPLVFVDDVRIETREDLPRAVLQWVEGGLRDSDLVKRIEVVQGTRIFANGVISIFTGQGGPDVGRGAVSDQPTSGPMPLLIVDGQREPWVRDPDRFGQAVTEAFFQDLVSLDIESFEILRGAAVAAFYGDEAADGVIEIITRDSGSGR